MFQRLKVLKDVLGLYLNRHTGLALLERVQASDLSDADRDRVSRIMRTMLKLPAGFCRKVAFSRVWESVSH